MSKRLYLFTLEVVPMEAGKAYNPLPAHLTLMSRFWSELSPEALEARVQPLFARTPPIVLHFGQEAILGPNKVGVRLVEKTPELEALHTQLQKLLIAADVAFETPQYVGHGHRPHVSNRSEVSFAPGDTHTARAAYLIEVRIDGTRHVRYIRAKFGLGKVPRFANLH